MASSPSSDAASGPEASSGRRARLQARRRRAHKFAVAAIVVGVALVVAAAGLAFYNSKGTSEAAAAGPTTTQPAAAVTDLPGVKAEKLRALDHEHPLRVWIGGDSLAGAFGFALGDSLGATGVVRTLVDYKVSSGLWSNDIRNWYQTAQEQMLKNDPELVVFMIGTNDTTMVNNVDANHDGVADWIPEYRAKVDREMETLIGGAKHRQVIWLGAPTLRDKTLDEGALEVDKVFAAEAKKYAPDVVYVDTYKLFEGPDGKFSRTIVDAKGKEIDARIGDGVHFTPDGAAYLAKAIFGLIDGRWHLMQQADPSHPIGWTYAEGNGELVPGYTSTPRSRYGSSYNGNSSYNGSSNNGNSGGSSTGTTSGGGNGGTTPPPTSPPATDPPSPPTSPHTTTPVTTPTPPSVP
jgi:hypothetical protein